MRTLVSIFLLSFFVFNAYGQSTEALYPINKGDLWGYINKKGKVVIPPQFYVAGAFSEGLAAVRLDGMYGYIDNTGRFVIPSAYDIAMPFTNGLAQVFIDGKPFFIDKTGRITFQHPFKAIAPFDKYSYTTAITPSGKHCVINKAGQLITDTIYQYIGSFSEGIATVRGLHHLPFPSDSTQVKKYEVGAIDSTGKVIVPFGRYKDISDFENGYALAGDSVIGEVYERIPKQVLLDRNGNPQFHFSYNELDFPEDKPSFREGRAFVYLHRPIKADSGSITEFIRAIIDTKGHIVLNDTNHIVSTPFFLHRAFAVDKDENWIMVDTLGKQVGHSVFQGLLYDHYNSPDNLFVHGMAFVKTPQGWAGIDTAGVLVTPPKTFPDVRDEDLVRVGDVILFAKEDPRSTRSYLHGFWNAKTGITVSPAYQRIDQCSFDSGMIAVVKDKRCCYITPTGKQVWMEDEVNKDGKELNIDYVNRGYCYAYSEYKHELAGYGGWATSDNHPQEVSAAIKQGANQLQLIIDPSTPTQWEEHYKGMKMYVANASKDTLYFPAQDSRLYLMIQALDQHGKWRDIEYMPSSYCGNSYHTLFLAPNQQWAFAVPLYHGGFKTKIRAVLSYQRKAEQKEEDIIYSNEVDGSVNPGQFWNKKTYYSRGIADPYND